MKVWPFVVGVIVACVAWGIWFLAANLEHEPNTAENIRAECAAHDGVARITASGHTAYVVCRDGWADKVPDGGGKHWVNDTRWVP